MNYHLSNSFFHFSIDSDTGKWNVSNTQSGFPSLESIQTWVKTIPNGVLQWNCMDIERIRLDQNGFSTSDQLIIKSKDDASGLSTTITVSLPEKLPVLLWKVSVENHSCQSVGISQIEMLCVGDHPVFHSFGPTYKVGPFHQKHINPSPGWINSPSHWSQCAFYSNGWGSWNFSGTYGSTDRFQRTRLGPITSPPRINHGTPQPRSQGHFASDMFSVLGDRKTRKAILTGFTSQKANFGSIEVWLQDPAPALRMWANGDKTRLDPGKSFTTDWACIHFLNLDDDDPLKVYIDAVIREHDISSHDRSLVGWCSWYQFFDRVTETDVLKNLNAIHKLHSDLPLEILQIDDGYESVPGDWFTFDPSFPSGVEHLAKKISSQGLTPGLWLAPYILHPKSELIQEHPGWILRNRSNKPVNAGYIWDVLTTALDISNPEALEFSKEVISTASQRWGFEYLKLDFLYAGALPGVRFDPTQTRAQILRNGLEQLRYAAGKNKILLGCGCPLGSGLGIFDFFRIGADVAPNWHPRHFGTEIVFHREPDFPSARNAIQNCLTRSQFHNKWWVNDPDCLLVRANSRLSLEEIRTLATVIGLTGGAYMISDDLTDLPEERLRIAQVILPLIQKRPKVIDWFDRLNPRLLRTDLENASGQWSLLSIINWESQPVSRKLDLNELGLSNGVHYSVREFWSGKSFFLHPEKPVMVKIPGHGIRTFSLREINKSRPLFLGSNLHISQGLEVVGWSAIATTLRISLSLPRKATGEIELLIPHPVREVLMNGYNMAVIPENDQRYRIPLQFDKRAEINLSW